MYICAAEIAGTCRNGQKNVDSIHHLKLAQKHLALYCLSSTYMGPFFSLLTYFILQMCYDSSACDVGSFLSQVHFCFPNADLLGYRKSLDPYAKVIIVNFSQLSSGSHIFEFLCRMFGRNK